MGLLDILNPFQADKPAEEPKTKVEQPITPVYQSLPGTVDPKITSHFEKLMENANIPGPDYFEFKKALKKMVNVPEQMAFGSTFTAFETMGVTKEKLLSSIDTYIGIVQGDSTSFKASVDKKMVTDVTNREDEVRNNTAKILALQQQIVELQTASGVLNNEIQTSRLSIQNTQSAYEMTAGELIRNLESDKSKINQYLT